MFYCISKQMEVSIYKGLSMYFSSDYKAVEFHVNIEYVHNIEHVFLYMYKQKCISQKRGVIGQLIKQQSLMSYCGMQWLSW